MNKTISSFNRVFTLRLIALAAILSTNLSAVSAQPEKSPLVKCWSRPAVVVSEAGISADPENAYFVSGDSNLQAVDVKTGETVWSTEIGGKILTRVVSAKRSLVVISNGTGKSENSMIRSISLATGITNWTKELPAAEHYFAGDTESGIAVVSSKSDIWLINENDGTIIWRSAFSGEIVSEPEIGARQITVATSNKKIESFLAANGKRKCSFDLQFLPVAVSLVEGSEAVYSDDRGGVYSTNIGDSTRNWKFKAGGKVTDLQTVSGKILVASVDNFVYLMSPDTGNIYWKRRMPGRIANLGMIGPDSVAVTVIGERSAYIIDTDSGKFTDLITLAGEDAFLLTPIRANGSYILTATVNGISGFSSSCGKQKAAN